MADWQSMEVYPSPGERVLLADESGEVGIGYFDLETGGFMMEMEPDSEGECEPLAWMPLPAHPGVQAQRTTRQ